MRSLWSIFAIGLSLSHQIIYHIIITGMQFVMLFIPMLFRMHCIEKPAVGFNATKVTLFRIASNRHTTKV